MLRIIQNSSAGGAKGYYSTSDYYSEGQELVGRWRGNGAELLGLSCEIAKADWDALCDNRNPATGDTLTPRQKEPRRVGYDFNFHVPKSVSVLYGLTGDDRIVQAFRESVDATMSDIEAEMKTRVRKGGKDEDRVTGNMVWGEYIHTTARPVGGVPDPHLHAHCFVFNTTFDPIENRWKAGQFADLKRDGPYFEAGFHSRLARRMEELGLPVARTRDGWELDGVPHSVIDKFSRRTELIEKAAKDRGITGAVAKSELGAKTREAKLKQLAMPDLRAEWWSRLTDGEDSAVRHAYTRLGGPEIAEHGHAAREAALWAVDHCFERSSVVPRRTILAQALRHGFGAASLESVGLELDRQGLILADRNGRTMATTHEVLDEEKRIVAFARDGRGVYSPLGRAGFEFREQRLDDDQRHAVLHVLNSRDRVMVIRGRAGTGKTTMMREAVRGIEEGGHRVFTFAPSADASRGVLRSEGFASADTVARLLVDEMLQSEIAGQVIWVDEAGLLGTRTAARLLRIADACHARVILSGDTRQHAPVERGGAMKLLEREAGLRPADLREIHRQRDDYRQAVKALADGRTADGFTRLQRLGWIKEAPGDQRDKALARDYAVTLAEGKTALVVSPTHAEGNRVTKAIREELRHVGRLGSDERTFPTLESAHLTRAELMDPQSYNFGDVLVFHQNAKGFTRGERVEVTNKPLPLDQPDRFELFYPGSLSLARGDVIRITHNGTTADGQHRLDNGALFMVKRFTRSGNIELSNGWKIAKDFGHLAYGYVVTSHASQGKTVDRVLISQSADSFPASSPEQFYVSVSRGRERATVYTDCRHSLLEAVSRRDERMSATDLVRTRLRHMAATRPPDTHRRDATRDHDRRTHGENIARE